MGMLLKEMTVSIVWHQVEGGYIFSHSNSISSYILMHDIAGEITLQDSLNVSDSKNNKQRLEEHNLY